MRRTNYKLATFTHRALSGQSPLTLSDDCQAQLTDVFGWQNLCSTDRCSCLVSRQNSTIGDRSFAAAGPRAWNDLQEVLCDPGLSLNAFIEHLTYICS